MQAIVNNWQPRIVLTLRRGSQKVITSEKP